MWRSKMVPVVVVVVAAWGVHLGQAIRVDDKQGFTLCNGPMVGELQGVEVDECSSWPCFARAGRSGTYHITLTQHTNDVIYNIKSDIYAWVKLPPVIQKSRKPVRVSMPGEKQQPLCRYTNTGCPIQPEVPTTITKTVTIPSQARMAQGNVVVEFRVTDELERVLTCFRAPVIVA